jgi:DNA-binding CsgD family transcriptional regulator
VAKLWRSWAIPCDLRGVAVNPIDVVEAAYDLDGTDAQWLHALATAVRPLIDGGQGMASYVFDLSKPHSELHRDALLFDIEPKTVRDLTEFIAANPEFTAYVHSHGEGLVGMLELCRRAGLADPRSTPAIMRLYRSMGLADYAALQTIEPGGFGVVFSAGQSEVRTFDARLRRLWARVGAHIAAGRRLRHAFANHSVETPVRDDAVLLPSGKVAHAEGEATSKSAREGLRDAVKRIETARGKQRRTDPDAATEAWTAMVSGRWSLVDKFESGGRRYVVARRNEHALRDPRGLTQRERAVVNLAGLGKPNKLIGYELGLAESTVGSHLSTAMRKLGASSRVELIRLVSAFGGRLSRP